MMVMSSIYSQAVNALNFLVEHWGEVNELRSVIHRLQVMLEIGLRLLLMASDSF